MNTQTNLIIHDISLAGDKVVFLLPEPDPSPFSEQYRFVDEQWGLDLIGQRIMGNVPLPFDLGRFTQNFNLPDAKYRGLYRNLAFPGLDLVMLGSNGGSGRANFSIEVNETFGMDEKPRWIKRDDGVFLWRSAHTTTLFS